MMCLKPFMHVAAKIFYQYHSYKSYFQKTFEGEMFIPETQTLHKHILHQRSSQYWLKIIPKIFLKVLENYTKIFLEICKHKGFVLMSF